MNKNKVLSLKKHPILATIAGIVMGVSVSTSVLAAVTSQPTATVIGHIPVIGGGIITVDDKNGNNVVDTGDELSIAESTLTFSDSDTDLKDTTTPYTYSWQVDGVSVGINNTYIIQKNDLGKSITLKVIGHTNPAITDPADSGELNAKFANNANLNIAATPVSITTASGDEPTAVTITGLDTQNRPVVGVELTADATCVGGACGSSLKYQWQIEDAVGSSTYTDIPHATTQKYIPTKDDQKKHIRVSVTK
jgi:hypothetical protein